jgi:hypothetical protein
VNARLVEEIANAVLYEGYILYPYRPSALKNRHRFNFGVVAPMGNGGGSEGPFLQAQCLARVTPASRFIVRARFLQLVTCSADGAHRGAGSFVGAWQEGVERQIELTADSDELFRSEGSASRGEWPAARVFESAGSAEAALFRRHEALSAVLRASCDRVAAGVARLTVRLTNTTQCTGPADPGQGGPSMQSLVSAHVILQIEAGEFVSTFDPPADLLEATEACRPVGLWPVLVGAPNDCDAMLASPIILYDHPQIAPESAGDFFDGTEIDEMLALRVITMTDDEKREMRAGDERARRVLERTESLADDQLARLHGVLRGLRPAGESAR